MIFTLKPYIVKYATKVLEPVGLFALWGLCGLNLFNVKGNFVFEGVHGNLGEVFVDGFDHTAHDSLLLLF